MKSIGKQINRKEAACTAAVGGGIVGIATAATEDKMVIMNNTAAFNNYTAWVRGNRVNTKI